MALKLGFIAGLATGYVLGTRASFQQRARVDRALDKVVDLTVGRNEASPSTSTGSSVGSAMGASSTGASTGTASTGTASTGKGSPLASPTTATSDPYIGHATG